MLHEGFVSHIHTLVVSLIFWKVELDVVILNREGAVYIARELVPVARRSLQSHDRSDVFFELGMADFWREPLMKLVLAAAIRFNGLFCCNSCQRPGAMRR
jgi:hypothetical protein